MRSSLLSMATYIGTILLAFGIVILVIEILAGMNGVRHEIAWILAIGCLGGGAVLAGVGALGRRSGRSSSEGRTG